jgi:hypothetical protein
LSLLVSELVSSIASLRHHVALLATDPVGAL